MNACGSLSLHRQEEGKATDPAEPIAEDATGDDVGARDPEPLVPEHCQQAGSDELDEEAGERAPLVDGAATRNDEVLVAVDRDAVPDGHEQQEEGRCEN